MTLNIEALQYERTQFLISAAKFSQCPEDIGAEVAFVGRSNAGKSSAINALTRNKKMAKTSKTPGRTQLLNFFTLSDEQRLVDLPGYGYAKVPIGMKNAWQQQIDEYLQKRKTLRGMVLLMDIRHPLQPFDKMILGWAKDAEMPVHILLTKADKFKRGAARNALFAVQNELKSLQLEATIQLFSAPNREGVKSLEEQLDVWLSL